MSLWPFHSKRQEVPGGIPLEDFGLPTGTAEAVLQEPARAAAMGAARDRLTDLTADEKVEFVDRIVARFALTVGHLPASATYHHAGPFGLLDHSLEVAARALTASLEMRFMSEPTEDPGREYDLLPRWRYAAFLFGLLHDVGKVAQLLVESADGEVWNPFAEPLAAFLNRKSSWPPDGARVAVAWRRGRSLSGHERHNTFFVSRILTPEVGRYLGPVLPLALEQSSGAAVALAAIVSAADTESVVAQRRARLSEDEAVGIDRPAFISEISSVADYLPFALQRALESGALATNVPAADAFIGDHWIALRYPGALLKIMEAIRERWKGEDARAKHLRLDQVGVKLFVRELSFRQFVFKDRQSGTWKLKATIEGAEGQTKTFLVLVKKDILEAGAFRLFPGRIWFYSIIDQAPIAVDDFSVADAPGPAVTSVKPEPAAPAGKGIPDEPTVESQFIDPDQLFATIQELILSGTLRTNVLHGPCFVTQEVTYLVWPRAMVAVRETLGLPFNPMEERRPYTSALAQLPSVLKDDRGNVISSIKFRPDSERICRVIRIDTNALIPEKADLERLGFWSEAHLIQPAPEGARVERRAPA